MQLDAAASEVGPSIAALELQPRRAHGLLAHPACRRSGHQPTEQCNEAEYGSRSPPQYDLSRVTVPSAMLTGCGAALCGVQVAPAAASAVAAQRTAACAAAPCASSEVDVVSVAADVELTTSRLRPGIHVGDFVYSDQVHAPHTRARTRACSCATNDKRVRFGLAP